uniref:ABC-type oligopeptide transport system, substrate-binding protein n=1 Tax=Candidatus Kentrum sp. FW TaxID=2126338 RepID=A0A450S122_9GAMM|nr:MAG: ABC-type oligopeptide transport system, substrate-binding protein [Candidatus Kentron sp. FW]
MARWALPTNRMRTHLAGHLIMTNFLRPLELFCVLILLGPIAGCEDFSRQAEKRAEAAAGTEIEEIILAIVDSSSSPSMFAQGVAFAVDEINDKKLIKQKVIARYYDDRSEIPRARNLAKKLAADENVIAVIGHLSSATAIAASIIYERAGLIFITPKATQSELIRQENRFTFRNIPRDEVFGREATRYMQHHQYKKVAIIYDRELATRRLAELFHKAADDAGIEVVAVRFYSNWETDYRELITKLGKDASFDALFLSGVLPQGAAMIKQLRAMGIRTPIIAGIDFDFQRLIEVAGRSAEDTAVATVFDPKRPRNITRDFVRRFKERYGIVPDTWAAQGYDAAKLLAHAMVESGSRVPADLAGTLRFVENWDGVTGRYAVALDGNILGRKIHFKTVKNGNFAFLDRPVSKKVDLFETMKDETLRIGAPQGEISLDPCHAEVKMSAEIAEQLFLGLTDIDSGTLEPIPALATSWTESNLGKTYRFRLRKDAQWTDGRPVTAHDVVWAVRRNILPATGCWGAGMFFVLKNGRAIHEGRIDDLALLGVRTIDDYTVEFNLEQPLSLFPTIVNHFVYRPLPAPVIESLGEDWTDPERIVTSGAYRLAVWKQNMLLVLRRNDGYYNRAKVNIPEIRYLFLESPSMGFSLYRGGELDVLGGGNYLPISPGEYAKIQTDRTLYAQLREFPLLGSYSYGFRIDRSPMDLLPVRKAITAALDRDMMVGLIASPHEASTTFTPDRLLGADRMETVSDLHSGLGLDFNPNQAAEWLAKAGYPDGQGFPEIILLHEDGDHHRRMAQAVKASLDFYLGLDIQLAAYSPGTDLGQAIAQTDPHLFQLDWRPGYPHANNFLEPNFAPRSPYNHTGWQNMAFASQAVRARTESVPEIRTRAFRRLEQMITKEFCVVAPIYSKRTRMLIRPRIADWSHMSFGGQYLRDWRFEPVEE